MTAIAVTAIIVVGIIVLVLIGAASNSHQAKIKAKADVLKAQSVSEPLNSILKRGKQ
jgi:ABC-type molybdate transport system substrate-binding protein